MVNVMSTYIYCKPEALPYILREGVVDFSILIPQPKSKDECDARYIRSGKDFLEDDKARPWFDWYKWNKHHWGCKWNAATDNIRRIKPFNNSSECETVVIEFHTPWFEPWYWLIELAKHTSFVSLHKAEFGQYYWAVWDDDHWTASDIYDIYEETSDEQKSHSHILAYLISNTLENNTIAVDDKWYGERQTLDELKNELRGK